MLGPESDRTTQLRADLAARLQRVRGEMSDEDFAKVVAKIVRTKLRFEEIEARCQSVPTPVHGTVPSIKASGSQPT